MNKPIRHTNHILETRSKKFFESCLPNEWTFNIPNPDYGIDYHVDIVVNNQLTGLNFSVQVKSTTKDDHLGHLKISLKRSSLNYYSVRLEPILLVEFVEDENEAYWVWINELDIDLSIDTKTCLVSIPRTNKLSTIKWDKIIVYVQDIFNKRSFIGPFEIAKLANTELLAWKAYYDKDYKQSIYLIREALKGNSENEVSLKQALAWSLYMNYDYSDALVTINELLQAKTSPQLYQTKACILAEWGFKERDKGKIVQAKDLFKKFIGADSDYHIFFNYGNTLNGLEQYDEAVAQYKICLGKNPNYAECWKNLGSAYSNLHQHDEEMDCYNKAIAINPDLKEALVSKGITLIGVFQKYEEGLSIFETLQQKDSIFYHSFLNCVYWIAFAHEQLGNLDESLSWVNRGLDYLPSAIYFLNFKSNLLAKNWQKHPHFKDQAIKFFSYRLELDNDLKSLYYLIKLKGLTRSEAYELIKEKTPLFKNVSIELLDKFSFNWDEIISVLHSIEVYGKFRITYPLTRYTSNFISPYYSVSAPFWELLDLVCLIAFNNALQKYNVSQKVEDIPREISAVCLSKMPPLVDELLPDQEYPQNVAMELLPFLYLNYCEVILREIGLQSGHLTVMMNLRQLDPDEYISKEWNNALSKNVLSALNDKLKLLKK